MILTIPLLVSLEQEIIDQLLPHLLILSGERLEHFANTRRRSYDSTSRRAAAAVNAQDFFCVRSFVLSRVELAWGFTEDTACLFVKCSRRLHLEFLNCPGNILFQFLSLELPTKTFLMTQDSHSLRKICSSHLAKELSFLRIHPIFAQLFPSGTTLRVSLCQVMWKQTCATRLAIVRLQMRCQT